MVRLTGKEQAILGAIAALDQVTPSTAAYQLLRESLLKASRDDLVRKQLDLHAERDSRRGRVVGIRTSEPPTVS